MHVVACPCRVQENTYLSAELDVGWDIRVLHGAPDALTFLRHYVSCSKPVLIKGYAAAWPAVKYWNKESLVQRLSNKEVRHLHLQLQCTTLGFPAGQPGPLPLWHSAGRHGISQWPSIQLLNSTLLLGCPRTAGHYCSHPKWES